MISKIRCIWLSDATRLVVVGCSLEDKAMSFFSRFRGKKLTSKRTSSDGDQSGYPSEMTDAELSTAIHTREAMGHTGRTDPTLHALNCAQTDRLSTSEIRSLIAERQAQGKPTGKLEAALRYRGE